VVLTVRVIDIDLPLVNNMDPQLRFLAQWLHPEKYRDAAYVHNHTMLQNRINEIIHLHRDLTDLDVDPRAVRAMLGYGQSLAKDQFLDRLWMSRYQPRALCA